MREYSSRRDNQNETISVEEWFSFNHLMFLISVSLSYYATVNYPVSNILNTNWSLALFMELTSCDRKCFSIFLLSSNKLCRIKSKRLCLVCNILSAQAFQFLFTCLIIGLPTVLVFLKRVNLSVRVRIFSLCPCIHLLVFRIWEMAGRKTIKVTHQMISQPDQYLQMWKYYKFFPQFI